MTLVEAYRLKKSTLHLIENHQLAPSAAISAVIIEPVKNRELFRLLCATGSNDEQLICNSFFETEEFDVSVLIESPKGIQSWHTFHELNGCQNSKEGQDTKS